MGGGPWPDAMHAVRNSTGERRRYVPERTCINKVIAINKNTPLEFRTDNFNCSNCNALFFADGEHVNYPIDWAYCPNCGAKVEGVDE